MLKSKRAGNPWIDPRQLVHTDNIQRELGGDLLGTQHIHWCGAITLGDWSVAPIMRTSYHYTSAVANTASMSNQRLLMSAEMHPVALVFVKEQQGNYIGWVLGDDSNAVSTFLKAQEKALETGL